MLNETFAMEGTDLIDEGITTNLLDTLNAHFHLREGTDLIDEGITTPGLKTVCHFPPP